MVIGRRSADPTRASSAGATHPPAQPHEDATLVAIDDPARSMSRQHLRVTTRADGSVWAEDLGSGNGTLLERGGDSVSALAPSVPVRIVSRDVLVLGDHRVRVVRRPPGASPPTSAGHP
jgi:pSer/pThr/pTyr-binding forkhead associated (FHA) protein